MNGMMYAAAAVSLATVLVLTNAQGQPKLEEILAKLPTPGSGEVFVRTIPADVLRDYPGMCYSFNNHGFFHVNSTWAIEGVCATAQCLALPINDNGQLGLFEQVYDCGPRVVKNVTACSYTRNEDVTKSFPSCCPTFECDRTFNARDLLLPPGAPQQ